MRFAVTTKNCLLSEVQIHFLSRRCRKMERFLPDLAIDLPLMSVTIKKHEKRDSYRGSVILQLPKKTLIVRTEQESVDLLLRKVFERLTKELTTYKGKHYTSQSDYRDHTSLKHTDFSLNGEGA